MPDAMAGVASALQAVKKSLPEGVTLVAVSKFHPADAVRQAYEAGQRHFGESRAQELRDKAAALPADIVWHFIGHLQTNKVRPVVAVASVIQSIDSLRLLDAVGAEARRIGRTVDVLLQVHVARELTKTGFLPEEMADAAVRALATEGVRLTGVMGMASNTDDASIVKSDFARIAACFNELKQVIMAGRPEFAVLSMGMSGDAPLAIEAGSTMVRIGTAIFGERNY